MARILLINGPNLNLLGRREPETYGATTLGEIEQAAAASARELGHELEAFQSNAEAALLYAREPFRHKSYLSDIAVGVITGLGAAGYGYAVQAAARALAPAPA